MPLNHATDQVLKQTIPHLNGNLWMQKSDPFLRTSLHQRCEQNTPVVHRHTREHEHVHTPSDTNTDNRC